MDDIVWVKSITILERLPQPVTMKAMHGHMKQFGHGFDPIVNDSLARQKIKCPIYWDNDKRLDMLFANYLCTCGKLFIFQKTVVAVDGKESVGVSGTCPCDVCRYWNHRCAYGSIVL